MKPTIKKPKATFDELSTKYKKANAHTKNRKIGISGRSNWSFWFPHVNPMFQLLADAEIQSSQTHLQSPSRIVRIGERGRSIQ
jgi:hypothetical protein